jgi:hypothetical protein
VLLRCVQFCRPVTFLSSKPDASHFPIRACPSSSLTILMMVGGQSQEEYKR